MVENLPVVVKAQPVKVRIRELDDRRDALMFEEKDVVRERSGWEERENALKSRIDEISRKLKWWFLRKPDDIDKGVSASEEELLEIIKELELLGLSK